MLVPVRKRHHPTPGRGQTGALFFDDIVAGTRRLATDVERGLWELVARGLATADGFQALRSLMSAGRRRPLPGRRPWGQRLSFGVAAGRWAMLPVAEADHGPMLEEMAEAWAGQLLRRYGVVLRALVQREALAVPWREVLRALRRLEAWGLVRGGRFVEGFFGEQYALPEAVEALRRVRRREETGEVVWVNATDPLNLLGIATPGPRLTAVPANALVYQDGLPEAAEGGITHWSRYGMGPVAAG